MHNLFMYMIHYGNKLRADVGFAYIICIKKFAICFIVSLIIIHFFFSEFHFHINKILKTQGWDLKKNKHRKCSFKIMHMRNMKKLYIFLCKLS